MGPWTGSSSPLNLGLKGACGLEEASSLDGPRNLDRAPQLQPSQGSWVFPEPALHLAPIAPTLIRTFNAPMSGDVSQTDSGRPLQARNVITNCMLVSHDVLKASAIP